MKLDDLIAQTLKVLPEAEVGEDNDGQIVIHTGLREDVETGELVEF